MIRHTDLRELAKTRFKEVKLLHSKGFYDGAVYLCGYVVEMALKARICRLLKVEVYPDDDHKGAFRIHEFDKLLILSGLSDQITLVNKPLFDNWNLLTAWKPEYRYQPIGTATEQLSLDMIKALEDSPFGFLTWIKKRW